MRARFGLAQALLAEGRQEEAIVHLRGLLDLSPSDNQGVRYTLLHQLINSGRDEETWELILQYEDDASAAWAYSRALLKFREAGDGRFSRLALQRALHRNPHVPARLLAADGPPEMPPPFSGFGDPCEAAWYAVDAYDAWSSTPGALDWLASTFLHGIPPGGSDGKEPTGPIFYLNWVIENEIRDCPVCSRRLKGRSRHLVIHLERGAVIVPELRCRVCSQCDVLVARERDVEPLAREDQPDPRLDYAVIGVIADDVARRYAGKSDEAGWVIAHLEWFREDRSFEPAWTWLDGDGDLDDFEDEEPPEENDLIILPRNRR
jgi:hypothetical protein